MVRRAGLAAAAFVLSFLPAPAPAPAAAQSVPRVVAGFGIDTSMAAWSELAWHRDAVAIYRAWSEYLRADPTGQRPTPLWSSAEQAQWPLYDLTAGIAYKGLGATVLDIRPAGDGSGEFVVKTLFASAFGEARDVRPVALTRVHAVQEDGRWVLANALPRMTRSWRRVPLARVTYIVEPEVQVDPLRMERSIAFADSLAHAFELPAIEDLTYYVASSPEALHRAMGVDWTFGAQGHGYASRANRMILSGDAAFGEENRHELVHYVLAPLVAEGLTHGIINEGIATWLGGSVGRSYAELLRDYAAFLDARPDVTLARILEAEGPDQGWYPAGAVLVHMVHERGGTSALRELLHSGRAVADLQSTLSRLLDASWQEIEQRWRTRILNAGRAP